MRIQDLNSADVFSQLGGVMKKNSPIMSSSGGITSRETDEYVILPQDVLRLEKREFYYFGFEGQFIGKTFGVKASQVKVDFPNILQEEQRVVS